MRRVKVKGLDTVRRQLHRPHVRHDGGEERTATPIQIVAKKSEFEGRIVVVADVQGLIVATTVVVAEQITARGAFVARYVHEDDGERRVTEAGQAHGQTGVGAVETHRAANASGCQRKGDVGGSQRGLTQCGIEGVVALAALVQPVGHVQGSAALDERADVEGVQPQLAITPRRDVGRRKSMAHVISHNLGGAGRGKLQVRKSHGAVSSRSADVGCYGAGQNATA